MPKSLQKYAVGVAVMAFVVVLTLAAIEAARRRGVRDPVAALADVFSPRPSSAA